MPKLLQPSNDSSLLTPTRSGRSTSILDKVGKMFGPTDWVNVINPDVEPYIWQWLPPQKEQINFDPSSTTVPQRIIFREEPEVYKLDPGQSATLVGANAYVMLDGLVKRMMAKKAIARQPNMAPGQARNFNFSDDIAQEQWINEIYLGRANPYDNNLDQEPDTKELDNLDSQIDKDLGLTNAPEEDQPSFQPIRRAPGRPRRAA